MECVGMIGVGGWGGPIRAAVIMEGGRRDQRCGRRKEGMMMEGGEGEGARAITLDFYHILLKGYYMRVKIIKHKT